jgi:hypothetical protein
MRPVHKADNLTTILRRCQEIWEPSEPLQALNETALTYIYNQRFSGKSLFLCVVYMKRQNI